MAGVLPPISKERCFTSAKKSMTVFRRNHITLKGYDRTQTKFGSHKVTIFDIKINQMLYFFTKKKSMIEVNRNLYFCPKQLTYYKSLTKSFTSIYCTISVPCEPLN